MVHDCTAFDFGIKTCAGYFRTWTQLPSAKSANGRITSEVDQWAAALLTQVVRKLE
jgi:hypothetical protein